MPLCTFFLPLNTKSTKNGDLTYVVCQILFAYFLYKMQQNLNASLSSLIFAVREHDHEQPRSGAATKPHKSMPAPTRARRKYSTARGAASNPTGAEGRATLLVVLGSAAPLGGKEENADTVTGQREREEGRKERGAGRAWKCKDDGGYQMTGMDFPCSAAEENKNS